MVGSGIDNQYRYSDISQVDNLITDFYRPFDQSVVLVKLPCKFPECLTGLIRTIKDPLLHAHKILCLFFIIQKIDQIHIFLTILLNRSSLVWKSTGVTVVMRFLTFSGCSEV